MPKTILKTTNVDEPCATPRDMVHKTFFSELKMSERRAKLLFQLFLQFFCIHIQFYISTI